MIRFVLKWALILFVVMVIWVTFTGKVQQIWGWMEP